MSAQTRVRVGVTMGDPAGIGPEVALKAVADPRVTEVCDTTLYGARTAAERERFTPGVLSADAGRAAYEAVEQAVADAMAGRLDAITTGPIHKEALSLAGFPWRGHTELLAHLTGARDVAMMFHSPRLRVVLATVHVPLSDVPRLLTQARVETTLALAASELPRFGVTTPRLALAGLNPHAGEGGLMGLEDRDVLVPAVESARRRGIDVTGPVPADTVFRQAVDGRFDAVIACYHDQGADPGQACRVRRGGEHHTGAADHQDVGRPWDRVRHRWSGRGRRDEPGARGGNGRPAGAAAGNDRSDRRCRRELSALGEETNRCTVPGSTGP